ncbi:high-affinity iron permease [Coemansia spiralis]|nr:high-affinity iron permease [Coemansia spiralis]
MPDVFNVPVFFILFRETLETAMVISVMLSFCRQMFSADPDSYRRARKHIWIGAASGFGICAAVGAAFIAVFYTLSDDLWSRAENLWEGIFSLIAAAMITVMGLGMLRAGRMQDKWRGKLAAAMATRSQRTGWRRWVDLRVFSSKYLFFHLPFLTVLREGLEAVVFVGGVSLGVPARSIPLPVVTGLLGGALIGFLMFRVGNAMAFQWFFVVMTCVLYLIAAGLFSRAVWFLESHAFAKYAGGDPDRTGVFDVRVNVWALECCNPEANDGSGWGVFNALLGWQNIATYGSVISYCLYWAVLAATLVAMRIKEIRNDRRNASADVVALEPDLADMAQFAAESKHDPPTPTEA